MAMAKYDLDASHSDPYARRTNRAAIAGLLGTAAIVIGASWLNAHPYQGGTQQASTWHATIAYNGKQYDAAGAVARVPDPQMARVGTTSDGRGVFQPVGGGGGQGSPQLYVQMSQGLYLPIKPHTGQFIPQRDLGGIVGPQGERRTELPNQGEPGVIP